MEKRGTGFSLKQDVFIIMLLLVSSCLLTAWAYRLWEYDFSVPLGYASGDGLLTMRIVKGFFENGTYFENPLLGAPFGSVFIDYPIGTDFLHLFILYLLSNLFGTYTFAFTGYYLLLFPLTALVCYITMRMLGNPTVFAFVGALLFSFSPYRFLRGTTHYFLSAYTLVPLGVLLLFWLAEDARFLSWNKDFWKYKRNIMAIVILALFSISGLYYSFFLCFFCIVVAALCLFRMEGDFKKALKNLLQRVGTFTGIVVLAGLGAFVPMWIQQNKYGASSIAVSRGFSGAEIYGLKLSQLLVPVQGHGIPPLEALVWAFNNKLPLANENRSAYLGVIGALGFLALLVVLFLPKERLGNHEKSLVFLSRLNLAAILLATIGGFSTIIGIFIPQIRGYNRISVYILFFSILCACMLMRQCCSRVAKNKRKWIPMLCAGLCMFSLWEQIIVYQGHTSEAKTYHAHEKFVQQIETTVGSDGMIFQLPYQGFPEQPPINNMQDYAQSIGYLHSDTLRWSYGEYKGREGDEWVKSVSELPTDQMVNAIAEMGFDGIYINTTGYLPQELLQLQEELALLLEGQPLVSEGEELLFYPLPFRGVGS